MNSTHCMNLYLAWTRSQNSEPWLSMVFGVTGSVVSLFIRFARRIIVRILCRIPQAALKVPCDEDIEYIKAVVSVRHPVLQDLFCVADGLKLRIEQISNAII